MYSEGGNTYGAASLGRMEEKKIQFHTHFHLVMSCGQLDLWAGAQESDLASYLNLRIIYM